MGGLKSFLPQMGNLPGGLIMFLVNMFVSRFHLRKHWNNPYWLVYDNNNEEFYWVYHFILKAHACFLRMFCVQHNIFSNGFVIFFFLILKVILSDSHSLDFSGCYKYCLTVLHMALSNDLFRICQIIFNVYIFKKRRLNNF